jgi:hypothetical protein
MSLPYPITCPLASVSVRRCVSTATILRLVRKVTPEGKDKDGETKDEEAQEVRVTGAWGWLSSVGRGASWRAAGQALKEGLSEAWASGCGRQLSL